METSEKTGYKAINVLIEVVKMLYADYLKYIEINPQDPNKGKEKKRIKKDQIKNKEKKKDIFKIFIYDFIKNYK